jgi:hypothetical protein
MTKEYLNKIVSHYDDTLDYPDLIEMVKYKVFDMDSGIDILDTILENYGENPCYNNPYIMTPDKYINGWSEMADKNEYKQCVKFSLRCAYSKLIPRLKNKNVLSDTYMDTFLQAMVVLL